MKVRKPIHDNWATPPYFLDEIRREFGDFFDPCPLKAKFDGLSIDWKKVNYINPPYSQKLKEAFIHKAFEESKKGKTCVMLIPASTETKIFHDVILPNAEIRFLKGRIKFHGINSKGDFVTNKTGLSGSMLVIFNRHC